MARAVIIAKGEVQGVGYRGVVFKIARKLNLVGYVENIKPYDVRIIAEGEKENLDTFIQQIKLEEEPILVEEVEVTFEEPTSEFEYFEVRRGDMSEELGERLDLARYEMKKFNFTTLREDYGKISENIEKLIQSIDRTSKNTERILDEMKEERKESRMAMDKILNAILKLAEKARM